MGEELDGRDGGKVGKVGRGVCATGPGHWTLTKALMGPVSIRLGVCIKYRRTYLRQWALFLAEPRVRCEHGLQGDLRPRRGVLRVESAHLGAGGGRFLAIQFHAKRIKEGIPRLRRDQWCQSQ